MNTIALSGRIANDLEVKKAGEHKVLKITLAVKRTKDITDFIQVAAWDGLADIVFNGTEKGKLIGVTGNLLTSTHEDDKGKRTYYEVRADKVDIFEWKEKEGEE